LTARLKPCPTQPIEFPTALLQAVCQSWNGFQQIVVDDHDGEEYQEDECGLVDAFLDAKADVVAHQTLDEEEENDSSVEDRDGQQVKDAEIQADGGGQEQERRPTFAAGSFSGGLADADGALDGAYGNFALQHFLYEFENQEGSFFVLL